MGGIFTDSNIFVIDLFAGAGGLTEGFFRKNFEFISHLEMNQHAVSTLETRSLYYYLEKNNKLDQYYAYIKGEIDRAQFLEDNIEFKGNIIPEEITVENEQYIIKRIKEIMELSNIKKVNGIIGGPPCQAYSTAGRGRDPRCMENDPRNFLYLHYLKMLDVFKPDFFVFENVPGMLSAKKGSIYRDFETKTRKMGYNIFADILNAKDFFVLQSRKRLIVIGFKGNNNLFDFAFKPIKHRYHVSSLLRDLPSINPGEGADGVQKYSKSPSKYLIKSGIRKKEDRLIQHRARIHNDQDREIYRIAIEKWNKEKRRLKYGEIPSELRTHKKTSCFEDRFKVVAGNMSFSHTIVAHISKDGHYNIHPDIKQARSLTVREAARIQSFPDNYKFEGPMTAQFWQVGNAVPPLMAEGIASKIMEILEGN